MEEPIENDAQDLMEALILTLQDRKVTPFTQGGIIADVILLLQKIHHNEMVNHYEGFTFGVPFSIPDNYPKKR